MNPLSIILGPDTHALGELDCVSDAGSQNIADWARLAATITDPAALTGKAGQDAAGILAGAINVAAILPDQDITATAHQIAGIVAGRHISVYEWVVLLAPHAQVIADLRVSLRAVAAGTTLAHAAQLSGVCYFRLRSASAFLGTASARAELLEREAPAAARHGVSAAAFAARWSISISRAHTYLRQGRSVLAELEAIGYDAS